MPKNFVKGRDISEEYNQVRNKYDALGVNLAQALEQFLREKDIKILSVNHRIKQKESFLEKIERKGYEQPFDEIEDICGLRIICYYQSDVDKICEIISKEFEIIENQDKEELLSADQFGYRSTHFIVKIKRNWLQVPNYRGLENLKAEIQIRTVLMHAWAEIEHKLAYKKKSHIPDKFKRKLSRISAKLEEADEQFEELRNEVVNYKQDIVEIVQDESKEDKEIELNLDSLQAFLDAVFPDREKDSSSTIRLVDEFIEYGISLKEFVSSYERVKSYLPQVEEDTLKGKNKRWYQVGAARTVMNLTNENYLENKQIPEEFKEWDRKWRKIVLVDEAKNSSQPQ